MIARLMGIITAGIMLCAASSANAVVIYDWTGDCTGRCVGTATGVLQLVDAYTPGTSVQTGEVVSWSYLSSSGSYNIPTDLALGFWRGTLPAVSGFSVANTNTIFGGVAVFNSFNDGVWNTGGGGLLPSVDFGDNGTWSLRVSEPGSLRVPEPGTLAMFGLGLAGLGFARRRKLA